LIQPIRPRLSCWDVQRQAGEGLTIGGSFRDFYGTFTRVCGLSFIGLVYSEMDKDLAESLHQISLELSNLAMHFQQDLDTYVITVRGLLAEKDQMILNLQGEIDRLNAVINQLNSQ